MKNVIQRIKEADEAEVEACLMAALERKRQLYPHWRIEYHAVECDPIEEARLWKEILRALEEGEEPAEQEPPFLRRL